MAHTHKHATVQMTPVTRGRNGDGWTDGVMWSPSIDRPTETATTITTTATPTNLIGALSGTVGQHGCLLAGSGLRGAVAKVARVLGVALARATVQPAT